MERAARGSMDWARDLSLQDNAFALPLNSIVCDGHGGEQGLRIGMYRICVELLGLHQLDNTAQIHHCHRVCDVLDDCKVMRNEHIGQPELCL